MTKSWADNNFRLWISLGNDTKVSWDYIFTEYMDISHKKFKCRFIIRKNVTYLIIYSMDRKFSLPFCNLDSAFSIKIS